MRARILGKRKPIDHQRYTGDSEILEHFRVNEKSEPLVLNNAKVTTLDYLIKNTNITKNGIASALRAKYLHDSKYETTHRLKRMGPNDKNDLIWMFSKIHGLENIAFLTEEQLELIKDPFTLQRAINNVK